jgi:Predicted acyltransferases
MDELKKEQYFDVLQVFRGIAALLVVVHHTYISFAFYHHLDVPMLGFIASIGKLGVDFFFVLSGFIITYSTFKNRNNASYLRSYYFNRIIKIYTPYLPISVLMILLYTFLPGVSNSDREFSLVTSLTLIPYGNPALAVAWTLIFEMCFYTIYSLNFVSVRLWNGFLFCWIIYVLVIKLDVESLSNPLLKLLSSWYNLEFLCGIFIAYLIKREILVRKNIVAITSLLFFISFIIVKYFDLSLFDFHINLLFTIAVSGFVYLGVVYQNMKINRKSVSMLLGNSSYSLYLTHSLIQVLLVRILPRSQFQFVTVLKLMFVIFICCIIGYGYFLIFEKKLMGIIKKKLEIYFL